MRRCLTMSVASVLLVLIPCVTLHAEEAGGFADRMRQVVGDAKDGMQILRAWSAYRAGSKASLAEIFAMAKGGNATAQNFAGWILDNGEGVKQDSAAAYAYFMAATKGYPLAKYNVGVLLVEGRGVQKNESLAMTYFEQAAKEAGVAQAEVRLAIGALKAGQQEIAWKWANQAADHGNETGYYLVGRLLFLQGKYKEAYPWLIKASQASEPNSPALLARLYEGGLSVDQNRVVAAGWWLIYSGMNKSKVGATGLGQFNLDDKGNRDAAAFAEKWLSTHESKHKTDYKKTIYEVFGRNSR